MDELVASNLPVMVIPELERRRRLTVAFRFILVVPHFLVSILVGIVALFLATAGWFSALFIGRLPDPIARNIASCLRYIARVHAYAFLLTDQFPPFTAEGDHPVDFIVRPGRLNRWAVGFRIILAVPAMIVNWLAGSAATVIAVASWFAVVFTGRTSSALFKAGAATVRFENRVAAYVLLATSAYPSGLFGDGPPAAVAVEVQPPQPNVVADEVPAQPDVPDAADPMEPHPTGTFHLPGRAKAWIICAGIAGMVIPSIVASFLPLPPSFVAMDKRYEVHLERVDRELARLDRCLTLTCSTAANTSLAAEVRAFLADLERIDFPEDAHTFVAKALEAGDRLADAIDALAGARSEAAYEEALKAQDLDALGTAFDERIEELGNYLLGVP